jgi:23S rRNA pseudouridine1911/1915/1917 synthase
MNIEIIKETKDYLVINKPSGISMHKDGKREEFTVADWVLEKYPQTKEVGESFVTSSGVEIEKPGIVHRLDKDTSGAVLIALNQDAYKFFKEQFQDRDVQKVYHLFAYGNLKEDLTKIEAPIGKDRKDFRKRTTKHARGEKRDAITNIKILNRIEEGGEKYIFVEARPKTGRTHQIRVHMKHLSSPIICDRLYASKKEPALGFERLALHAQRLIFKNTDGVEEDIIAKYPGDFEVAINNLDKETLDI